MHMRAAVATLTAGPMMTGVADTAQCNAQHFQLID